MPERLAMTALIAALLALPGAAETISPEKADELRHLLYQDCGSCHGLTRKGGLGSPLTPEAMEGRDRDGLVEIILDGLPGTAMPPWRPLMTEAEAYWIADYLLKDTVQ
jgi:cytochrome c55X